MKQKIFGIIATVLIIGVAGYYLLSNIIKMYACAEGGGKWSWSNLECTPYQNSTSEISANGKADFEEGYPWSEDVTKAAIQAIHKSIKNLKKPENQRNKNFPANPYNMPFNHTKIEDFTIVGYSKSKSLSDVYQIHFQPKAEVILGPSITVEINVKTKEPMRVYMLPDA